MTREEFFWSSSLGTFVTNPNVLPVKGLYFIPEFMSMEEETRLLETIDGNSWSKIIKRRQQFYGDVYYHTKSDFKALQPGSQMAGQESEQIVEKPVNLPMDQLSWLTDRCVKEGIFGSDPALYPDQVLVNEYVENVGIRSHFDDSHAFGPVIATVSIGDPIWMTIKKPVHHSNSCPDIAEMTKIFLPPRSCLVLSEDSRYLWRHGIGKAKFMDDPRRSDGQLIHRNGDFRRISLTIRKLLDGRKKVAKDSLEWRDIDCNQVLCVCYNPETGKPYVAK